MTRSRKALAAAVATLLATVMLAAVLLSSPSPSELAGMPNANNVNLAKDAEHWSQRRVRIELAKVVQVRGVARHPPALSLSRLVSLLLASRMLLLLDRLAFVALGVRDVARQAFAPHPLPSFFASLRRPGDDLNSPILDRRPFSTWWSTRSPARQAHKAAEADQVCHRLDCHPGQTQ
jgi:hypothetical protein